MLDFLAHGSIAQIEKQTNTIRTKNWKPYCLSHCLSLSVSVSYIDNETDNETHNETDNETSVWLLFIFMLCFEIVYLCG